MFTSTASTQAIGDKYLEAFPEEARIEDLMALASIPMNGTTGTWSTTSLRQAVKTRSEEDFAAGRVVVLDGVVLARAEGALCALITLLQRERLT